MWVGVACGCGLSVGEFKNLVLKYLSGWELYLPVSQQPSKAGATSLFLFLGGSHFSFSYKGSNANKHKTTSRACSASLYLSPSVPPNIATEYQLIDTLFGQTAATYCRDPIPLSIFVAPFANTNDSNTSFCHIPPQLHLISNAPLPASTAQLIVTCVLSKRQQHTADDPSLSLSSIIPHVLPKSHLSSTILSIACTIY